jgi:hypothetical protein
VKITQNPNKTIKNDPTIKITHNPEGPKIQKDQESQMT